MPKPTSTPYKRPSYGPSRYGKAVTREKVRGMEDKSAKTFVYHPMQAPEYDKDPMPTEKERRG